LSIQSKNGYNRNYWAMALEGAFFMGGIAIIGTSGSVALFIDAMTGSKTLIGLAVTVQTLFMLSGQLFSAPFVRSIRKLPEFLVTTMAIQRVIPLLMALPLFLGFGGYISVGIFLVLYSIFWIFDGVMVVPWGEICARALKSELRGHMMGMQVTIGGAASLLTGLLLTWLLATQAISDNYRFAFIFVLASAVLLISLIPMRMVRDPNPLTVTEKPQIRRYYARVPSVVRGSKPLQCVMLARGAGYVGFSALSFLIVFGSGVLKITETQVSWLVYASIVGGLIGGIIVAEISRRFGNKVVILFCNICVFIAIGMAIMLTFLPLLGYVWLFATCTLASLSMNIWVGYFNYILDIAPGKDRSVYQVVNTCVGIPFSFAGYAMGAIIDNFGYVAMFCMGGIFVVATIFLSMRLQSKNSLATFDEQA